MNKSIVTLFPSNFCTEPFVRVVCKLTVSLKLNPTFTGICLPVIQFRELLGKLGTVYYFGCFKGREVGVPRV